MKTMFLSTFNHSKAMLKIVYRYFLIIKCERKLTLDLFQVCSWTILHSYNYP